MARTPKPKPEPENTPMNDATSRADELSAIVVTAYGENIAFPDYAVDSVRKQLTKALKHTLGNVTESAVLSKNIEPALKEHFGEERWKAMVEDESSKAEIKKWKADNAALFEEWKRDMRKEFVRMIKAGELPAERGEGLDSLTKIMERIAWDGIKKTLAEHGVAEPEKGQTIMFMGEPRTRESMIANRLASKRGAEIEAAAKAELEEKAAEKARKALAAAENAKLAKSLDVAASDLDL